MKNIFIFFALFVFKLVFSQSYHDTQGKLDITNSGQAVYTVPIALPPSLQNIGPTINLVYASGQFGGVIGQGWNINSISMISRMASSIQVDGYVDGVDFDDNDKLALDGQRLIIKSGNYWESGSIYQTEIQSNNKIEQVGTGDNIYFIVTNTDGSRSWYGNYDGVNATDLTAFYITRFEDSHGNYILYDYFKPFGKSLCLKNIKFSANIAGILPLNELIFNYKQAKRIEIAYIKGNKHEKDALLSNVEVKTNNQLFRKYEIIHEEDSQLGYEKVTQIKEFNGNEEAANPINFDYFPVETGNTEVQTTYDGFLQPQSGFVPGDFDGDGYLDFYNEGKIYTKLFQGGTANAINAQSLFGIYPIQTLSLDNKLNQHQSFTSLNPQLSQITVKINEINQINNNVISPFSKTISFPNSASIYSNCPNFNPPSNYIKTGNKYIEGDYNGDGISELLILSFPEQKVYQYDPNYVGPNINSRTVDPSYGCIETITIGTSPNVMRILDLNPNSSTTLGTKGYLNIDTTGFTGSLDGKYFAGDFNGDGKTDVFVLRDDKSYTIFSFKQLLVSPWTQIELIGNGILTDYHKDKILLFGDFNGDSKTDIIIPVEKNSDNWAIYFSNPKLNLQEVFEKEIHQITTYKPDTGTPGTVGAEYTTQQHFKNYYVLDVNKDGKSDLVMYWVAYAKKEWWQYHNFDTKWKVSTYINNLGNTNASLPRFYNDYTSASEHNSGSPEIPVPLVSSFRVNGANKDFVVLRKNDANAIYVQFARNYANEILLKEVSSSQGAIIDKIEYKEIESLNNNGLGYLNDTYSSTNSEYYPNFEFKRLRGSKIVDKLTSTIDGKVKYQSYKYHGLTANLSGLGLIGYKKTARSSWYLSPNDNNIIWSVFENDVQKRGANSRSYTQLKSINDFTFNLGAPTNYISKTENNYVLANPSHPYALLLSSTSSHDSFTNVKTEVVNQYSTDGFYIPHIIVKNNFLGTDLQGTYTTTTSYENNEFGLGNDYYIGRPTSVVSLADAYGDTFETTEKYNYTGNLLTRLEKKGNSTEENYIIEDYEHDDYANITKKTVSVTSGVTPYIAPRTIEQTYDATGRFVISSKDIEELITTYSYNSIYGLVETTTNPFSQVTTNYYDNWGKLIKVKDYLNKNLNISYSRNGNLITTSSVSDDGSEKVAINDILGRNIKSGVKNIDNTWSYKSIVYDYLGRKFKESEPYKGNNPLLWNTTIFDEYSRTTSINYASGLILNLTYDGLKTTANDGTKQTSSTKNANGHVVQSTDPGGEINFTFYANGNQKTATYEDNEVYMEYNNFGLKTKLIDPSAGTYIYNYNFLGQIIHEGTPKGNTYYDYNPSTGKLTQKRVIGATSAEKTSIITDYNYNPVNKLPSSLVVTDIYNGNSSYLYEYDSHNRLKKTIEELPFAKFENEVIYDSFGREQKVKYEAKELATNKISSKWIRNVYYNGYHKQIFDDGANTLLWSSNTVNERGQLTSGTFGNELIQTNTYDNLGFPTILNTSKIIPSGRMSNPSVVDRVDENPFDLGDPIEIDPIDPENTESIINLTYSFNTTRALLNSRQTNLFNLFELFEYDNLERLTVWKSPDETLHNLTFSSYASTEGFVATSGATISSSAGRLRINTTPSASGGQKLILSGAALGTKLNISATITKNNINKLRVVVIEKDPITNTTIQTVLGEPADGIFVADYVVSAHKDIYLKFDKSPSSTDVGVLKTFYIDNVVVKKINRNEQQYDNRGRITQNNLGNYGYNIGGKAYQNSSVELTPAGKEHYSNYLRQDISYNAFKSPIQIHEQGKDKIDFSYNTFQNRSAMYYGNLNTDKLLRTYHKFYSGDGTIEIKKNINTGEVEFLTYIGGDGYTAPVVLKSNGTTENYLYLHRDLQGSIIAITNQSGEIVEKRHFDAWGNIAKVQDGAGNNLTGLTVINRGYTGHEHLQGVKLIHMNGRLYDPLLHRFLQPDNFIQDPNNTQNYNRYGYVLNNPLKYTDPSGEYGLATVAIGVGVAIAAYMLNAISVEAPITFQGVLKTSIISLWSSFATMGIGEAATSIGNFYVRTGFQAISHGTIQGGLAEFNGDKFINGFSSGAISSVVASLWQGGDHIVDNGDYTMTRTSWGGIGGNFAQSGAGTLFFGTISGGLGARLTGGNFWQGAATGLVVSGLNHLAHKVDSSDDMYSQKKNDDDIDFDSLFDNVLKNKTNTVLTADDLIKKYSVSSKIKDAIKSVKVLGNNKVYVDWNNEGKINFFSDIRVKDGVLSLKKHFIASKDNPKVGRSGYIINGNGLRHTNYIDNPVFVHNSSIFPYHQKTNTISKGSSL